MCTNFCNQYATPTHFLCHTGAQYEQYEPVRTAYRCDLKKAVGRRRGKLVTKLVFINFNFK